MQKAIDTTLTGLISATNSPDNFEKQLMRNEIKMYSVCLLANQKKLKFVVTKGRDKK